MGIVYLRIFVFWKRERKMKSTVIAFTFGAVLLIVEPVFCEFLKLFTKK